MYVILYFSPRTLNDESGMMREIVDKYFNDNWIITTYMGHVVDLSIEWAGYRAAKAALDNVLQPHFVSKLNMKNMKLIEEALDDVKRYLVEGILTEQFVIDNIQLLIDCMRKCNVALRWRMLHRRTTNKKFYDIIVVRTNSPPYHLVRLPLAVAHPVMSFSFSVDTYPIGGLAVEWSGP